MADTFAPRLIDDADRGFPHLDAMQLCPHQYFHFELISPGLRFQLQGLGQGIEPEARLGVGHPWTARSPHPEVGEAAAQESEIDVKELLGEVDLVFVTCGMGGGTGTGSAHVIAKAAKEQGALVIGIVTMPFTSEGKKRMKNAMEGLEKLKKVADTTIAIPNDKLLFYVPDLPLNAAFKAADMVLANAVKGITELITKPGLVNLDFADVRTIISDSGMAMIGLGEVSNDKSKDRILAAAEKALTSPLLDLDVSKATKALINITGGEDMTLGEAEGAVNLVSSRIAPEAHVIWGATVDKNLTDGEVRVLTVLAGIRHEERAQGNRSPVEVTGNEPIDVDFI